MVFDEIRAYLSNENQYNYALNVIKYVLKY